MHPEDGSTAAIVRSLAWSSFVPAAGAIFQRVRRTILNFYRGTPCRSQDGFLRQKIERFFWRDFSGEEFPENSFLGQKMSLDFK